MKEANDDSAPGTYGDRDPGGGPWIEKHQLREWFYPEASAMFADTLRFKRQMIGITQAELAERMTAAGIPFYDSTVAKIEKRQRRVHLDEAQLIARILGVDIAYMTGTDYPADVREWLNEQHRQQLNVRRPSGEA
ncbi:helix-turn-helix domain-containing protein [Rhodococcus sp. 1139]|uniref:helix-turn-helix domain-containing protein n=1 Tax=Rhodococcus sp. 1139 TaxID=1833762 RepID=UPI000871C9E7|nr:helix-turn-helix transcriptional regulator [Rhodococcus sp. 1139]OFE09581.1 hypothetical protein A5N83_06685 [Rhodococcus sp. 1139]